MSTSSDFPGPRTATRRPVIFMFAGQGSQYFAMGRELYERSTTFRDWMHFCSRLLEPSLGLSLAGHLYGRRQDRFSGFDQTRLTHPAIFMVNYSVAQTLREEGIRPDCVLGYSLGELVAWTFAGVLRLEDALELVLEMAIQIEEHTPPGAMLAVIASPDLLAEQPELFSAVTLGGVNYARNFVVTGTPEAIEAVQQRLRALDVPTQVLAIRRGFHSPLLQPVERALKAAVGRFSPRHPELPIISAMLARQLTPTDLTPQHCWEVIRQPVNFWDTIKYTEAASPADYIDAGPSGSLATFVRNIVGPAAASRAHGLVTPFGNELTHLEKMRRALGVAAPLGCSA